MKIDYFGQRPRHRDLKCFTTVLLFWVIQNAAAQSAPIVVKRPHLFPTESIENVREAENNLTGKSGVRDIERSRVVSAVSNNTSYPEVGALLVKGVRRHLCTGTLIGPRLFLTANHCMGYEPGRLSVYLQTRGLFDVISVSESHPEFKEPYADLALLTLKEAVEGIPYAEVNTDLPIISNTGAILVGFGVTHGDRGDSGLMRSGRITTQDCDYSLIKKKYKYTYEVEDCEKGSNCSGFGNINTNHLICWDYFGPKLGGANHCNGDSGGPLLISQANGTRKLIGTTVWGVNDTCIGYDHSWDVDVRGFVQWIKQRAGRHPVSGIDKLAPPKGNTEVTYQKSGVIRKEIVTQELKVLTGTTRILTTFNTTNESSDNDSSISIEISDSQSPFDQKAGVKCSDSSIGQYLSCSVGTTSTKSNKLFVHVLSEKPGGTEYQLSTTIFQ